MDTFDTVAMVAFLIILFSPLLYFILLCIYSEVKKYSKNSIKYCKIKLSLELIFCIYFAIELVSFYIISIHAKYINFWGRFFFITVFTILVISIVIVYGIQAKSTFSIMKDKERANKVKIIKFPENRILKR